MNTKPMIWATPFFAVKNPSADTRNNNPKRKRGTDKLLPVVLLANASSRPAVRLGKLPGYERIIALLVILLLSPAAALCSDTTNAAASEADAKTLRVFIFAGQSNMVGTHAKVQHIRRFPPFAGLDKPQQDILFAYKLGREEMKSSDGWIALQPTEDGFGPELSFAKRVSESIAAPIAIIKCASGGATLGEDWNPDKPGGFKLYPLALQLVNSSLAELDRKKIAYRIEGFMWHQGENDMSFSPYRSDAARWLQSTVAESRRDLALPALKWYVSQQPPTDQKGLNRIDITAKLAALAAADPAFVHVKAFDLAPQEEQLVITTAGIVQLGELLARSYLQQK